MFLLASYRDLLTDRSCLTSAVEHSLSLVQVSPVRKSNPSQCALSQQPLEGLEEYHTPVLVIRKQDGTYQLCLSIPQSNKIIIFNGECIADFQQLFTTFTQQRLLLQLSGPAIKIQLLAYSPREDFASPILQHYMQDPRESELAKCAGWSLALGSDP